MKRTPLAVKEQLSFAVKHVFADLFPEAKMANSCLRLAGVACHVLKDAGLTVAMQAGSAFWPYKHILLSDEDTNCFGYEYSSRDTARHILMGQPPEIHVWVGIGETNEIVDFTAGFQRDQCKSMLGHDWSDECALPDFIWHNVEDCVKKEWSYRPVKSATQLAVQIWNNQLRLIRGQPEQPLMFSCTADD